MNTFRTAKRENRIARHVGRLRPARRVAAVAGAVAALVAVTVPLCALTLTAGTSGAEAATTGIGIEGATVFGGYAGSYTAHGVDAYCGDPSREWPSGDTDAGSVVGSVISDSGYTLSGAAMSGVNAAYSVYGHGSAVERAAFNILVYAYTGSNLGGGVQRGTQAEGAAYISPQHPEILAKYNQVWDYAQAHQNSGGSDTGSYTFIVDQNNYTGTVTAHIGATGGVATTTTLTNGVFTATGTSTITGLTDGATASVTGVPPADATSYEISAAGTVNVPGGAKAELTEYNTGSQQRLLAGTAGTTAHQYTISGHDPFTRSTLFAPTVGTRVVNEFVPAGQKPQDALTFTNTSYTDTNNRTINNPWTQKSDGSYRQVTAKGTLYGPSTTPFTESDSPPTGTPVAGHATVTTSDKDGPTVPYTATSDTAVSESGYYTWVWSIHYADQIVGTQHYLPSSYSFTDRFGLVAETSVSPSQVSFSTKLSSQQVGLGGTVTDTITPVLSGGGWVQKDGVRIPVTLTGRVYYSPDKPVQATAAPADADLTDTLHAVLTGPSPVTTTPYPVGTAPGWKTVQWSIEKAAQPAAYQGYFADWSDDWGVAAETVQITGPTITTNAVKIAGPGATVYDTVKTAGLMPVGGVDVLFTAYQQAPGTQPVCTPATALKTDGTSVHVTVAGSVKSPPFTVPTDLPYGSVINWVDTATMTGTGQILHIGKCGDGSEQTTLIPPVVTSTPPTSTLEGGTAKDSLHVTGWVPAGTVTTVTVYKQPENAAQPACTPENLFETLKGTHLKAGPADKANYSTAATKPLPPGHYAFVHTTHDQNGAVIAQGACTDEPFTVTPALAHTGNTLNPLWAGGIATTLLIAGATALYRSLRQHRKN